MWKKGGRDSKNSETMGPTPVGEKKEDGEMISDSECICGTPKEKSSRSNDISTDYDSTAHDAKPLEAEMKLRYHIRPMKNRVLYCASTANASRIHMEYLGVRDGPLVRNEEGLEQPECIEEEELTGFDLVRKRVRMH